MKRARAWGVILVLLVGSAALGGCRETLGGVRPLATPVAGYRVFFEADEPWTGLERTWRFGYGTSETGMSLVAHTWEKPGIYDVRATAGRHGFWESQVEVRAPGEPVDLAELLGTGPKGATATAAIIVYRPEDEGSYCLLEDATGQVYEKFGVIGLLDPSGRPGAGYILKAPLAEVVPASVIWNPGRVGRLRQGGGRGGLRSGHVDRKPPVATPASPATNSAAAARVSRGPFPEASLVFWAHPSNLLVTTPAGSGQPPRTTG